MEKATNINRANSAVDERRAVRVEKVVLFITGLLYQLDLIGIVVPK